MHSTDFKVRATFAVNARLAEKYPYLISRLADRGDEIICHGWHMDTHPTTVEWTGKLETALVSQSLEVLRSATGQSIEGWISPGRSQSENTPDILVEHGVRVHG